MAISKFQMRMVDQLEMPFPLAGLQIDRDEASAKRLLPGRWPP